MRTFYRLLGSMSGSALAGELKDAKPWKPAKFCVTIPFLTPNAPGARRDCGGVGSALGKIEKLPPEKAEQFRC